MSSINKKMVILNLVSFLVFPIWIYVFYRWFGPPTLKYNTVWISVFTILCIVVHEVVHYLAIRLLNPTVKVGYGFRLPFTLFVRIEGVMSARQRVIFLLAPSLVLTTVFWVLSLLFPLQSMMWIVVASINASGSSSDLWECFVIVRKAYLTIG
ncbi:MAG: hypothetical protein A2201_11580 [Alicyclobacillus sp. RIFOXYA1_FULL_53_8]|nr:MAG: hypothetical protein A2201_11580 [Alicyclobacillus sp. RIFOXYA1_FULL_53_8]